MKNVIYCFMLLAIGTIWFACGYSYAEGSMEPVTEVHKIEVPVEVRVEKSYSDSVLIGLTGDLREMELEEGYNPNDYLIVFEVRYNKADTNYSFGTVQLYIDLGDMGQLSKQIVVPSNDFEIKVIKGSALLDLPDPVEGEEF